MSPERNVVIIVEDDPAISAFLASVGEAGDFLMYSRPNLPPGSEHYTLRMFIEHTPALRYMETEGWRVAGIWTDYHTPEGMGSIVIPQFKLLDRHMPVVVVAGAVTESQARAMRADLLVRKPVGLDEIPKISRSFEPIRMYLEGRKEMRVIIERILQEDCQIRKVSRLVSGLLLPN